MLSLVFSSILFLLFVFFPILLWGYGVNMLSHHEWNRIRFLYGMIGGGLSVLILYFLRTLLEGSLLIRIFTSISIIIVILWFVWWATARGSIYAKVFLRKMAFLHAAFFLGIILLIEYIFFESWYIFDWAVPILGSIMWFVFAASIEESLKHLSSVGLTAKQFRFTRRDLLIFAFFITLGFVFVENILYLILAFPHGISVLILTGMSRSFFSLLAHLLSASICVMFWWRALWYGVFSWKYSLTFLSGFILATFAHALFNILVEHAPYWWLILYASIAYIVFTQWLALDTEWV